MSKLDEGSRRPGPPEPISRLSVAAALLVVAPWIVLFAVMTLAEMLGFADSIIVPMGMLLLLCMVTSLVLGIVAILRHTNHVKLRGLAYAVIAVVSSLAELKLLVHLYASGFIGPHGRRLRVRGRPVLARVRALAGGPIGCPSSYLVTVAALDEVDCAALADYWTLVAREEHASITAFERLAVALHGHGAPCSLIDGARVAAQQEADHAARCFALASACAGQLLEPCKLEVEDASTPTLVALAVEALIDGCLGEGTSAAEAALLVRGGDTVAAVHDTLVVIASDETEHAELSWAVLTWCLAVGGEPVHMAVKWALQVLARRERPANFATPSTAQRMHGMATPEERATAWQTARNVTVTRASALLRSTALRAA